jgi:hypothetical protein
MTSEKINIRFTNCISRNYTHEELTKEINDLDLLRDAVLYLRNSFIGTGYNMDYVDMYFTEINNPSETK